MASGYFAQFFEDSFGPMTRVSAVASAAGNTVVAAAVPAQRHKVYRLILSASAPVTAEVRGGATVLGTFSLVAGGTTVLSLDRWPWFVTGLNVPLQVNLSAAVAVGAVVDFITEA